MYYPKSKIIENLSTNGDFLCYKSTGKVYQGFYHKLYNGKFFSGKNPKDAPVEELELFNDSSINTDDVNVNFSTDNLIYNFVKRVDINKKLLLPKFYYPKPTQEDYKLGEFSRYFVKKINENYILEVNKDDYEAVKGHDKQYLFYIFLPFELVWKIRGNLEQVINHNIIQIENVEQREKIRLKNYFKNKFDKYHSEV